MFLLGAFQRAQCPLDLFMCPLTNTTEAMQVCPMESCQSIVVLQLSAWGPGKTNVVKLNVSCGCQILHGETTDSYMHAAVCLHVAIHACLSFFLMGNYMYTYRIINRASWQVTHAKLMHSYYMHALSFLYNHRNASRKFKPMGECVLLTAKMQVCLIMACICYYIPWVCMRCTSTSHYYTT